MAEERAETHMPLRLWSSITALRLCSPWLVADSSGSEVPSSPPSVIEKPQPRA